MNNNTFTEESMKSLTILVDRMFKGIQVADPVMYEMLMKNEQARLVLETTKETILKELPTLLDEEESFHYQEALRHSMKISAPRMDQIQRCLVSSLRSALEDVAGAIL